MIVCRQSGVYIYINNGLKNLKFIKKKIYGPFIDSEAIGIAIGDYNKNKNADIYISKFTKANKLLAFQFNNSGHYRTNILLENQGNLIFKDVTNKTKSAGNQNTFTSIFVDLGSGFPDLVLSHDTGKIEILKNNKGESFQSIDMDLPYGFWMGIAIGDYNNDGNLDFFFTNVGDTLPLTKTGGLRGDINKGGLKNDQVLTNKHLMIRNKGNYNFENVSDKINVADYGFG